MSVDKKTLVNRLERAKGQLSEGEYTRLWISLEFFGHSPEILKELEGEIEVAIKKG